MANCSQINNTTIKGTSAFIYDGTQLPCTDIKTCDDLNTVLAKLDAVVCNVTASIDTLTEEVTNITEDVMMITEDIININNQLNICCPTTTTTTTLFDCNFTGTADELNCNFTGTATQLPDPTTTTTSSSSTSTSSTTTSTTTILNCALIGNGVITVPPITTTTTTTNPLPPGVSPYVVTQGYTSSALACQNYNLNGGTTGGQGTPQVVYTLPSLSGGDIVYTFDGSPFVGNPALFYVITEYINLVPGLESTIQIDSTGHIINFYPLACLVVNV